MSKKIRRPQMSPQATRAGNNMAAPPAGIRSALQQGMALLQSGRLQEAERLFRSVLAIDPKNVNALQLIALILFQAGKFQEGEQLLRRAIKQRPKVPDLHYNMGNMLDRQGKLKQAVEAYKNAVTFGLKDDRVYNNLGMVLSKLERLEEAETSFHKAIDINPNNTSALSNYGLVLWKSGRSEKAIEILKQAIDIDSRCVDALSNLGIIYLSRLELDKAEGYLKQALEIDAGDFNAVNNLAVVYLHKSENDDALVMIRRALELDPGSTDAMLNMAKVLLKGDDETGAIDAYRHVLKVFPKHSNALVGLGSILTTQGKFDEAKQCFQKAQRIEPNKIGARVGLLDIDPPDVMDDEVKDLERLYKDAGISKEDKTDIAFCMAKTYEKGGEYEKAFAYLADGNRFKREGYQYDLDDDRSFFNRMKACFNEQFFQDRIGSGVQDKTPIFILGMPRSGTTLTEQILSSHAQVFGAGELTDMKKILVSICGADSYKRLPEVAMRLSVDDYADMGAKYIDVLKERGGLAERVTDKMPHNFLHVGMIRLMMPDAKIIHCRRNPIDNCLSIFKHNFQGVHKYAYSQKELGGYYLLYQDLMEHWHKVLPGFIFDLQYEDMVADQEGVTRRLLEFCDLPWDDNCLQFHKSERTVRTASKYQVRKKIYSDSVELWRRYENGLQPLIAALSGNGPAG